MTFITDGVPELGILDDPGVARLSPVVLSLLVLLPGDKFTLKTRSVSDIVRDCFRKIHLPGRRSLSVLGGESRVSQQLHTGSSPLHAAQVKRELTCMKHLSTYVVMLTKYRAFFQQKC